MPQVWITKQRRTADTRWRQQWDLLLPLDPLDPDVTRASNCSASGATHEHAQAGRDARRHGEHRGVDRGPRGRTRVPVLRPAGVGVQAAEGGHARHPQAVVVVPAVRDHLGGLTLHRLQDRLRGAVPWSADPAGVRRECPGLAAGAPGAQGRIGVLVGLATDRWRNRRRRRSQRRPEWVESLL